MRVLRSTPSTAVHSCTRATPAGDVSTRARTGAGPGAVSRGSLAAPLDRPAAMTSALRLNALQPGQIAPMARGVLELDVPYDVLDPFVNPHLPPIVELHKQVSAAN